jgi:hypothetical protein
MTDPLFKRFNQQRHTAKQRGIPWRLEFWEWLQIWQDSEHLHERGTRANIVLRQSGSVLKRELVTPEPCSCPRFLP